MREKIAQWVLWKAEKAKIVKNNKKRTNAYLVVPIISDPRYDLPVLSQLSSLLIG
jgi:hypothetical protein